ncbi:MAG TPA: cellulase family glycosylhydrolase [Gaiellaceae bacterium]|nr:cellulase family glycosylhydrolase [Gaiellaceae bacterium]
MIATRGTLPLRTGLLDPLFTSSERQTAFAMAQAAGATYIRLSVPWRAIAPAVPSSNFVATDPTSPGYQWTGFDSVIGQAEAAGLTPILDIVGTPDWAYARQPQGVNGGTPQLAALGQFATALATHYDGAAPGVPAGHVFQVWNEPNVSLNLNPVNPATYRGMVNAVADAVHAVDPGNVVVAGGLDPFGHPKSRKQKWYSTTPLSFMRALLCLSKGKHPHRTCSAKIHFDVWSHHPYTFGGAFGRARNPDDVSLGNLPAMRALLQAGVRLHRVVSAGPVQFWVTEFGWDTRPPRSHAAPVPLAARWTAESLYQMWHSGVSLVTWFLLQDYRSPSPYQSGLYFHSSTLDQARPKPVRTAFRFPFVAYLQKKTVTVWGRDATSDKQLVTIQLRHGTGGGWRTVALVRSNANGIFEAGLKLKARKTDWLRASAQGSGTSLAFSLTRPHDPHIGPWGK